MLVVQHEEKNSASLLAFEWQCIVKFESNRMEAPDPTAAHMVQNILLHLNLALSTDFYKVFLWQKKISPLRNGVFIDQLEKMSLYPLYLDWRTGSNCAHRILNNRKAQVLDCQT